MRSAFGDRVLLVQHRNPSELGNWFYHTPARRASPMIAAGAHELSR